MLSGSSFLLHIEVDLFITLRIIGNEERKHITMTSETGQMYLHGGHQNQYGLEGLDLWQSVTKAYRVQYA
jgi:hypothetical protein